jgi:hypothetical protein
VKVGKVTVKSGKYTDILMRTDQAAIAHRVLDAVRSGDIPRDKVDDLGIIDSVWLDPSVVDQDELDRQALFDVHREATSKVIRKAMRREPTIESLLENRDKVTRSFHVLRVKGGCHRVSASWSGSTSPGRFHVVIEQRRLIRGGLVIAADLIGYGDLSPCTSTCHPGRDVRTLGEIRVRNPTLDGFLKQGSSD